MRELHTRGFIADLDGTVIPDSCMEVPLRLQRSFMEISPAMASHIATGRTYEFSKVALEQLGATGYVITENGSRIIDPMTDHTIHEVSLTAAITNDVLDVSRRFANFAQCRFAGDPPDTDSVVSERVAMSNRGIFILDIERTKAEELMASLSELAVCAYLSGTWMGGSCVDINIHHPDGNKAFAANKLCELLNYDPKTLVAVGNDVNDLPMFDVLGYAVAPVDSHPAVLAHADCTIPSAQDIGFLRVVEAFRD